MKQYQINAIKEAYKEGCRIELLSMDGESGMPDGLLGTVVLVDDIGQIHMDWDNGRTLALNPEFDKFRMLK